MGLQGPISEHAGRKELVFEQLEFWWFCCAASRETFYLFGELQDRITSCDFAVSLSHGLYGTSISTITNSFDAYYNIHFIDGETDALWFSVFRLHSHSNQVAELSFQIVSLALKPELWALPPHAFKAGILYSCTWNVFRMTRNSCISSVKFLMCFGAREELAYTHLILNG